ncbi:MAG TPA: outer membrane beta-barrel protein, partial [Flavipsychrobacter sp.]
NTNNNGVSDVSNDEGSANNTSWRNPGVRTEQRSNLNFSYEKNKKWQLNGSYRFSNNDNYLERSSFRTTFLPQEENGTGTDSLLLQEENSIQNSATQQHSVSLRSKYRFSEKLSLRTVVSGRLSNQESKRNGDDITYEDSTRDINFLRATGVISDRQNNTLSVANTLMKSFAKKGRTLLLSLNLGYSGNNSETDNDNLNRYFDPPVVNEVRNHAADESGNYNSNVTINYTEPINEYNSVSLGYSNSYVKSINDREVEVFDNGTYRRDSVQSRGYENTNINNRITLNYWYNREKLTAGVGFEAEPYSRRSLQTSGIGNDVEQTGVNYFPRLFGRYNISKSSQLSLNYNGGITPPSIHQLQPIPDYTDSLNIFTGNPQLRPEVSNSIAVRYNNNNTNKGRNTWAFIQANWVNRKIVNKTEITGSRRTTTPVNADGNYSLGASLNRMEPLLDKKLKAILSVNGNLANNVSIVNGQLQEISNYTLAPKLRMTWFNDKWYEGSVDYSYRMNRVEGATQSNNTLQSHDLAHDGTFILPAGFRVSYYLSYMSNIGLAQSFQQEFFLMNVMLSKTFKKPNGLSLRVQAFDVFNNYPTVQRNIADNYYEDVAVNRIGSYLMFSVVYKFTSFPGKKVEDSEEE